MSSNSWQKVADVRKFSTYGCLIGKESKGSQLWWGSSDVSSNMLLMWLSHFCVVVVDIITIIISTIIIILMLVTPLQVRGESAGVDAVNGILCRCPGSHDCRHIWHEHEKHIRNECVGLLGRHDCHRGRLLLHLLDDYEVHPEEEDPLNELLGSAAAGGWRCEDDVGQFLDKYVGSCWWR